MSPAPAEEVALDCKCESGQGGSLEKETTDDRVRKKGPFRPDLESGILRRDVMTTTSQEATGD